MTFEQMWHDLQPVGRSAASGGYFRQPFTAAERECRAWFDQQCARRGLRRAGDGFGNVVGWWYPPQQHQADSAVLTGSHLDSVRDGGAFDGPLGVVAALAAVDLLRDRGFVPQRRIGIGVFIEEEGSRFPVACLGSRLATGTLDPAAAAALTDVDGVRLDEAWADAGLDPSAGSSLLAGVGWFVELHLEQGRDLVRREQAIGAASVIWPHGRYRFDFTGQANHAGSTAMTDRADPMLGYAAAALAAADLARGSGSRATFGRIEASPNATNVVPARVSAWLDARAESEAELAGLVQQIERRGGERARDDGTELAVVTESISPAVAFDPGLTARIVAERDWPVIASMAGHDAGVISSAGIAAAMLFVRNPSGISHAPQEFAELDDCLRGVVALADTLQRLAGAGR